MSNSRKENWLASMRYKKAGFDTKHKFCEQISCSTKQLYRWGTSDTNLDAIPINRISEILKEEPRTLIDDYWCVRRQNYPEKIPLSESSQKSMKQPDKSKTAFNGRFLHASLEALNGLILIQKLYTYSNTQTVSELVNKTGSLIIKGGAESTNDLMSIYSDPIKDQIRVTENIEALEKIENLIGGLALTAANPIQRGEINGKILVSILSPLEDWTIQLMIDQQHPDPSMKCILIDEAGNLVARGGVRLGVPLSESKKGLDKEVHHCVSLIANKLNAIESWEGDEKPFPCPDLSPEDGNKAFNEFCTKIRNFLHVRNASRDHYFATADEKMPVKIIDLLLKKFTSGEDTDIALRLFHTTNKEGHSPYLLETGRFGAWLIDCIKALKQRRTQLEGVSSTDPVKQTETSKGADNMSATKQNIGHIEMGPNSTLNISGKDSITTIHNYQNDLAQLKHLISNENQVGQAVRNNIQTLIDEEPKQEMAEKHQLLWSKIKNGMNEINASAKTVAIFNKAYDSATKVAPWLAGVFS